MHEAALDPTDTHYCEPQLVHYGLKWALRMNGWTQLGQAAGHQQSCLNVCQLDWLER
jgi:hypothetical protein